MSPKNKLKIIIFSLVSFFILDIVFSQLISFSKNPNISKLKKENLNLILNKINQNSILSLNKNTDKEGRNAFWFTNRGFILHPYLGYVFNNNQDNINNHGLYDQQEIYKKDENSLIIGIMGGSVAVGMNSSFKNLIRQELYKIPKFKDKDIKIAVLAIDGHKQPQQLLALNYFISLGAQYDILINLDGVNETYLAYDYNYQSTTPYFPQNWHIISQMSSDVNNLPYTSKIYFYNQKRQKLANVFSLKFLNHSQTSMLVWNIANHYYENKIMDNYNYLSKNNYNNFQSLGPEPFLNDKEMFMSKSIEVWKNSSIQINTISKQKDIKYFHFLQPNQYIKDSKPMSSQEISDTVINDEYKEIVEKYYPRLIEEGNNLKTEENINFYNMTNIYKNNPEPLYVDGCCHVNEKGYDIMAKFIIQKIVESF